MSWEVAIERAVSHSAPNTYEVLARYPTSSNLPAR